MASQLNAGMITETISVNCFWLIQLANNFMLPCRDLTITVLNKLTLFVMEKLPIQGGFMFPFTTKRFASLGIVKT